jgi:hypothetical protein
MWKIAIRQLTVTLYSVHSQLSSVCKNSNRPSQFYWRRTWEPQGWQPTRKDHIRIPFRYRVTQAVKAIFSIPFDSMSLSGREICRVSEVHASVLISLQGDLVQLKEIPVQGTFELKNKAMDVLVTVSVYVVLSKSSRLESCSSGFLL